MDRIEDVSKHSNQLLNGSQQLALLTDIIRDKNTCKAFMNNTIYSALVTISQKMNIGIPIEEGSRQNRHCVTWQEVIKALRDEPSEEIKHLAVHFLMVYWRKDLYETIMKTTHEKETEKAFLAMHNISFNHNTLWCMHDVKSCIASMYVWCFNQIKTKMNRILFAKLKISVSVTSGFVNKAEFKRRKQNIFYVNDRLNGTVKEVS